MKRKTFRIETEGLIRTPINAGRGLASVIREIQLQKIEVNETGRRKSTTNNPITKVILRKKV